MITKITTKAYNKYSFGIRFCYRYHSYYKNNNTKQEKIPGTDFLDNCNIPNGNNKCKAVIINYPLNTMDSLNKIIKIFISI